MTYAEQQEYTKYFSSISWDYFFTGTFRGEGYSPDSARRAAIRFFKPPFQIELCAIFMEQGSLYGRVHLHGLLLFVPDRKPTAATIWSEWYDRYGAARVEIPRSQEAISAYCTTYVTKELKDESYFLI